MGWRRGVAVGSVLLGIGAGSWFLYPKLGSDNENESVQIEETTEVPVTTIPPAVTSAPTTSLAPVTIPRTQIKNVPTSTEAPRPFVPYGDAPGDAADTRIAAATLLLRREEEATTDLGCSGAPISSRGEILLLTAWHCVSGSPDRLTVERFRSSERSPFYESGSAGLLDTKSVTREYDDVATVKFINLAEGVPVMPLTKRKSLRRGEDLSSRGFPVDKWPQQDRFAGKFVGTIQYNAETNTTGDTGITHAAGVLLVKAAQLASSGGCQRGDSGAPIIARNEIVGIQSGELVIENEQQREAAAEQTGSENIAIGDELCIFEPVSQAKLAA